MSKKTLLIILVLLLLVLGGIFYVINSQKGVEETNTTVIEEVQQDNEEAIQEETKEVAPDEVNNVVKKTSVKAVKPVSKTVKDKINSEEPNNEVHVSVDPISEDSYNKEPAKVVVVDKEYKIKSPEKYLFK